PGGCRHDPSLELVRGDRELTNAPNQVGGDPRQGAREALQPGRDPIQVFESDKDARIRIPGRIELVQVPAEAIDQPATVSDQVLSVVDEEPKVPRSRVEVRE